MSLKTSEEIFRLIAHILSIGTLNVVLHEHNYSSFFYIVLVTFCDVTVVELDDTSCVRALECLYG